MKYEVIFVATWHEEIEANSEEEANEMLKDNSTWNELTHGVDTKLLNVEYEINELENN
jgi:hypothetical protein|tara:strand:+ start:447 stop:620 length:174 start_codon:yes stop_codon:yes gene_type:complete